MVVVCAHPAAADRCLRHPTYFLASCTGCRDAQAIRIKAIRDNLASEHR